MLLGKVSRVKLVFNLGFASLIPLGCWLQVNLAVAQTNVLQYLELRDIGMTPAEIILSTNYQTILEFEGMAVQSASSGRSDQLTLELEGETIRLRANEDEVNTDLIVSVGGETALFALRSDPNAVSSRRYVVRNSPLPTPQSITYERVGGKTDPDTLAIGTRDLPPDVTLTMRVTYVSNGDIAIHYGLENDGEIPIVNDPSRLSILHGDMSLSYTLARVPPAGSTNVIAPGEMEYGTLIIPKPPQEELTFLWVLVQRGPGGHYAVMRNFSELLCESC